MLSGALRFADGSSPAGAPVDILYATGGSAFSPLATVRCAADGQWSTTVDLPRTGTVRARFPGDAHARAAGVELAQDHRRAAAGDGRLLAPPPAPAAASPSAAS